MSDVNDEAKQQPTVNIVVDPNIDSNSGDNRKTFIVDKQLLIECSGFCSQYFKDLATVITNAPVAAASVIVDASVISSEILTVPSKYYNVVGTWVSMIKRGRDEDGNYKGYPILLTSGQPQKDELDKFIIHLDLAVYLDDTSAFKAVTRNLLEYWKELSPSMLARPDLNPEIKRMINLCTPYHLLPTTVREKPSFLREWLSNFADGETTYYNGRRSAAIIHKSYMPQAKFMYDRELQHQHVLFRQCSRDSDNGPYNPDTMQSLEYDSDYRLRNERVFAVMHGRGTVMCRGWDDNGQQLPYNSMFNIGEVTVGEAS